MLLLRSLCTKIRYFDVNLCKNIANNCIRTRQIYYCNVNFVKLYSKVIESPESSPEKVKKAVSESPESSPEKVNKVVKRKRILSSSDEDENNTRQNR